MIIQFSHGSSEAFGFKWEPYVTATGIVCFNLNTFSNNFNLTSDTLLKFLTHLSALMPVRKQLLDDIAAPIVLFLKNEKTAAIAPETAIDVIRTITDANKAGLLFESEMELIQSMKGHLSRLTTSFLIKFGEAATGYSLFKANHKKSLANFLQNQTSRSIYKWVEAFPDHFLESTLRFFNHNWKSLHDRPEEVGQLLINIVFARLPQETYEELLSRNPIRKYAKNGIPGTFLPTLKLQEHLISINNILKIANGNADIFFQLLNQLEPVHHQYLVIPIKRKKQEVSDELLPVYELLKINL
jgi:hypothetical protein